MSGDGDHGNGDPGGDGDDEDEGRLQQYFSPAAGPALKAQPHHCKLHTRLASEHTVKWVIQSVMLSVHTTQCRVSNVP